MYLLDISIIIPAFNEEKRIAKTIETFCGHLQTRGLSCEIIVVDDGSADRTREIVQGLVDERDNVFLPAIPLRTFQKYFLAYM